MRKSHVTAFPMIFRNRMGHTIRDPINETRDIIIIHLLVPRLK